VIHNILENSPMNRPLIFGLTLFSLSLGTVVQAQSPDIALRRSLPTQGPAGLGEFLKQHDIATDRLPSPELRSTLDRLCQQRDCHASQLYWYTDLAQAQAAAQRSGKPILSLRLLGNLDAELSCANSRFFRVALYANSAISQQLRDRFILHWSSERPVPKMTIDFGDGRKLERTVTGNSIHYLMDSQGQVLDALPGLYSPQAFTQQLQQMETLFVQYGKQEPLAKGKFLADYHRDRLTQLQQHWASELQAVGLKTPPKLLDIAATDAETASRVAYSKMAVELPIVRQSRTARTNQTSLQAVTDEAAWQKLAQRIPAQLDANSLALMQTKLSPETNRAAAAQAFEQSMALDTARNEYLLHAQIHQRLMLSNTPESWQDLNRWVYAEMFLTPASDPWLGLKPAGAFAAIEQDGQVK
jgi:hypothetical protein